MVCTADDIAKVWELHNDGQTLSGIERETGIHRKEVRRILGLDIKPPPVPADGISCRQRQQMLNNWRPVR